MNLEKIREVLLDILEENFGVRINDFNKNFFDLFAAYNLLYIVHPLESDFGITFAQIIKDSDYNLMTLNNLSKKIWEILENESGVG